MSINAGKTVFPTGVAQYTYFVAGGAAGNLTVTGIAVGDKLIFVQTIEFDADGDIVAVGDLTSEFSITAANTINNTGGTATTDLLVAVTFAKKHN